MIDGPYKLPKGWRWVRLGEVCIINPRRPRIFREPNKPTSFIPMSAIDEETGTITTLEVRPFKELSKGYTYFEENDILFAKITPCMENGKAAIARGLTDRTGFGSTEFHVLRPKSSVFPEWIWLFIRRKQFREDAKKFFRGGVGQQRVPQEFLEHYPVPLPPLEEQKRIVARIEELMDRIKEAKKLRQETKKQTELLWQSVLAETFPQPGTQLPNGWRWVRLGDVFKLKNGKFIRTTDLQAKGNIPVYGSNGLLGFTTNPLLTEGRTIVIGRVGACGAINVVDAPCWISDNAMFVANWFIECDIEYIALALRNIDFSFFIKKGAQPSISQELIYNIFIPFPPLEVQKRIANYLQELHEKIKELKEVQTKTEEEIKLLEQSILEKAFRGEL
jgi:type I restriction enzyme S subunit